MAHHIGMTMSGLCAAGGVIGYARAKSLPSLIAGISLASVFGTSSYLIKNNKDHGFLLGSVGSSVLALAMTSRAVKTRSAVPVTLAALGYTSLIYYGFKYYEEVF